MTIVGRTLSDFLNGLHDTAYRPVFSNQQEYVDAYLDRVMTELTGPRGCMRKGGIEGAR